MPPAQEPHQNGYSFMRISSISWTRGHDQVRGLVSCPLRKNPSRMIVSILFRETSIQFVPGVMIWPRLSFVPPPKEPLQSCRLNTVSCVFVRFVEPVPCSCHELSFASPAQEALQNASFHIDSCDLRPCRVPGVTNWAKA